ncbi:hypothetical protein Cgig2_000006 [Carnegiea gigantea]|uniref:Ubiquitin-like protease family profile domain-containing protein n=1 Tax=Carnegiea gigantea TaxID=171969 RepID=A0A9Q1JVT4_9CARY|nr:hypothetical protein Cgig2_000006 [Carnegiea gigantea]
MQCVLSFDERLRHVREAYVMEKQAHGSTRQETTLLKARVLELEKQIQQFGGRDTDDGKGTNRRGRDGQTKKLGEDGDGGGADGKGDDNADRGVIHNMSDRTDVRGGTLKDDAIQEVYNDACDDGSVSEEICGARPPSANVTKGRNESADDTVGAGQGCQNWTEKVDDPLIVVDSGHCGPIVGTPANDAGHDHSSRMPSNAVTRSKKEDVARASSYIPPSPLNAVVSQGKCSTVVISKEVRHQCRNFDLPEASDKHANAEFLKGLINVVPTRGAGDRASCPTPPQAATGRIWDMVMVQKDSNFSYVFMPLFDSVDDHWLLLVGDVKKQRFLVYDLLRSKRDAPRQQLLLSAVSGTPPSANTITYMSLSLNPSQHCLQKVTISLALMKFDEFRDVLKWDIEHPECPQQEK